MCKIFISADPELYRCRSRSLRLSGVATSIRLENLFWQVLEEIGARDDLSVAQLITRLYDELAEAGNLGANDGTNFSSFLRVSCGRYLALQVSGRIPADTDVPIRSLDADWVLAGEKSRRPGAFPTKTRHLEMEQAAT
ncbi:MAG: ribbon-helix-helix domain-containing protein [Burkholderiaceae bacterium]|nr:ribbon-helix-helix domain-containing protein [Sulfuritalea sp.]MCF8175545.1 ribbon-helix-helix domain-containing protein [Burkholderiaceae bacterium]